MSENKDPGGSKRTRTRIKLCGLMREEDVRAALSLNPDYIGFILSKPFRRYVSPESVKRWREETAGRDAQGGRTGVKTVGVFVNEAPEYVLKQLQEDVIDIAQLHGEEDEEYIRKIQKMSDKAVIKAFTIHDASDIEKAAASPADYVLLDAGTGTGQSFDRSLIGDIGRPFFLAGGMNPENVAEAIEQVHPYAVDVSSGIETDGRKDPARMEAFVKAVTGKGGTV